MLILPTEQQAFDAFFNDIAPIETAYKHLTFTYIALKKGESFHLARSFIRLSAWATVIPSSPFASEHLQVGHYALSELRLGPRQLAETLLGGRLNTPQGDILFPSNDSGKYSSVYYPLFPEIASQHQNRLRVLKLMGGPNQPVQQPDLDWELKAANPPYSGLGELLSEYLLGGLPFESTARVEMIADTVAAVDGENSKIIDEQANICVNLAKGLEKERLRLGYRVITQGRTIMRSVLNGAELGWKEDADRCRGEASIAITKGSVLECVVSYDGIAQHFWFLFDPTKVQNPRRAAYEVADKGLDLIKKILSEALRKGDEARDFEAAIGWLFWMLGFSAVQLGHTKRSNQVAADLILTSPSGNFAIVECTTGLLKADHKLALLHERAQAVRRSLDGQFNHLHVLPVIVTSKSRSEIEPDLEQAQKLGILVLARENIDDLLNRTVTLPSADLLYEEARMAIAGASSRFTSSESLTLPPS